MIINDNKKVISHHGVKGMRWGIRRDRSILNSQKAENIIKRQSVLENNTKSDITSAKWMKKSLPEKVGLTVAQSAAVIGIQYAIQRIILKSKGPLNLNQAKRVVISNVINSLNKEIQGQSVLKRYTKTGDRNLNKKQYKKFTPESIIGNTVGLSVYAYNIYASYMDNVAPKKSNSIGKKFVEDNFDMKAFNEKMAAENKLHDAYYEQMMKDIGG